MLLQVQHMHFLSAVLLAFLTAFSLSRSNKKKRKHLLSEKPVTLRLSPLNKLPRDTVQERGSLQIPRVFSSWTLHQISF